MPFEGWLQDWSLLGESREQMPGLSSAWVLLAGLAHGLLGRIHAREEFALDASHTCSEGLFGYPSH